MNKQELSEMLHDLMNDAQRIKQENVNGAHEPQDLPPVLWYHGKRSNGTSLLLNACQLHDHTPPEILALTLPHMYAEHGAPELIIMGNEGFMDFFAPGEGPSVELQRGSMARDYGSNPATKIREVVIVTACQDNLVGGSEMVQVIAPFHYDDGLQIVWGDRQEYGDDNEGDVGGMIADVMRNAFTTTEEEWEEMITEIRQGMEAGQYKWPMFDPGDYDRGEWVDCNDEEVTSELATIEQRGFDVTEAMKQLFAEEDADFAEHVERADLVWDGKKVFGIGIKMKDPGYRPDPPDPQRLLPRLLRMLSEQKDLHDLDQIPVQPGIFEAMKVFEFSQEIEETLGKEEGHDDDSG